MKPQLAQKEEMLKLTNKKRLIAESVVLSFTEKILTVQGKQTRKIEELESDIKRLQKDKRKL